jgi:L-cystine uptake protein TcyP (sodium:dicarboxylate symporter family)
MATLIDMLSYLGKGFIIAVIMYGVIIGAAALVLSIKETDENKGYRKPILYTLLVLALIVLIIFIFIKIMPYMLVGILICLGMCILFLGLIFIYELIKLLINNFITKK